MNCDDLKTQIIKDLYFEFRNVENGIQLCKEIVNNNNILYFDASDEEESLPKAEFGYVTQSAAGSWKGLSIKPRNVITNLCDQNLQGIMAIVNVCSLGQSTIDVVSMQPSTLMYIKLLGIFLKAILISGISLNQEQCEIICYLKEKGPIEESALPEKVQKNAKNSGRTECARERIEAEVGTLYQNHVISIVDGVVSLKEKIVINY